MLVQNIEEKEKGGTKLKGSRYKCYKKFYKKKKSIRKGSFMGTPLLKITFCMKLPFKIILVLFPRGDNTSVNSMRRTVQC